MELDPDLDTADPSTDPFAAADPFPPSSPSAPCSPGREPPNPPPGSPLRIPRRTSSQSCTPQSSAPNSRSQSFTITSSSNRKPLFVPAGAGNTVHRDAIRQTPPPLRPGQAPGLDRSNRPIHTPLDQHGQSTDVPRSSSSASGRHSYHYHNPQSTPRRSVSGSSSSVTRLPRPKSEFGLRDAWAMAGDDDNPHPLIRDFMATPSPAPRPTTSTSTTSSTGGGGGGGGGGKRAWRSAIPSLKSSKSSSESHDEDKHSSGASTAPTSQHDDSKGNANMASSAHSAHSLLHKRSSLFGVSRSASRGANSPSATATAAAAAGGGAAADVGSPLERRPSPLSASRPNVSPKERLKDWSKAVVYRSPLLRRFKSSAEDLDPKDRVNRRKSVAVFPVSGPDVPVPTVEGRHSLEASPLSRPASVAGLLLEENTTTPDKSYRWGVDDDFTGGDLQVSDSPLLKFKQAADKFSEPDFSGVGAGEEATSPSSGRRFPLKPRNSKLDEIRQREIEVDEDIPVPERKGPLLRTNSKLDEIRQREIDDLPARTIAGLQLDELKEANGKARSASPDARSLRNTPATSIHQSTPPSSAETTPEKKTRRNRAIEDAMADTLPGAPPSGGGPAAPDWEKQEAERAPVTKSSGDKAADVLAEEENLAAPGSAGSAADVGADVGLGSGSGSGSGSGAGERSEPKNASGDSLATPGSSDYLAVAGADKTGLMLGHHPRPSTIMEEDDWEEIHAVSQSQDFVGDGGVKPRHSMDGASLRSIHSARRADTVTAGSSSGSGSSSRRHSQSSVEVGLAGTPATVATAAPAASEHRPAATARPTIHRGDEPQDLLRRLARAASPASPSMPESKKNAPHPSDVLNANANAHENVHQEKQIDGLLPNNASAPFSAQQNIKAASSTPPSTSNHDTTTAGASTSTTHPSTTTNTQNRGPFEFVAGPLRRFRTRASSKSRGTKKMDSDPEERIDGELKLFEPSADSSGRNSEHGSVRAPSPLPEESKDGARDAQQDAADEVNEATPRPNRFTDPLSQPTPKVVGAFVETPATVKAIPVERDDDEGAELRPRKLDFRPPEPSPLRIERSASAAGNPGMPAATAGLAHGLGAAAGAAAGFGLGMAGSMTSSAMSAAPSSLVSSISDLDLGSGILRRRQAKHDTDADSDPETMSSSAHRSRESKTGHDHRLTRSLSRRRRRRSLVNTVDPPTAQGDLQELRKMHGPEEDTEVDPTLDKFEALLRSGSASAAALETYLDDDDDTATDVKFEADDVEVDENKVYENKADDVKADASGEDKIGDAGAQRETTEENDDDYLAHTVRLSKRLGSVVIPGIRDARHGIERLEDRFSQQGAASEKEEFASKLPAPFSLPTPRHSRPSTARSAQDELVVDPVHPLYPDGKAALAVVAPRLYTRSPSFRLTILGTLLAILAAWYLAETAVCSQFCRPASCSDAEPCYWTPSDPTWGTALPVKLDEWATGGAGRARFNDLALQASDAFYDTWESVCGHANDSAPLTPAELKRRARRMRREAAAAAEAAAATPRVEEVDTWAEMGLGGAQPGEDEGFSADEHLW